jgi:dihydrofolate reductase
LRKLIESTFVSLDGVVEDPRRWAMTYFDEVAAADSLEALIRSDAMLMGRGTYQYLGSTFPTLAGPFAEPVNTITKYAFSSSLKRAEWNNSTIISEDLVAAVSELKQKDGGDLMIYGHGRFGQTLLDSNLIDELRLGVHPVIVGRGQRLFPDGMERSFTLLETKRHATGVVTLTYEADTGLKAVPRVSA